MKDVTKGKETVKLQLWDTAGQECQNSLTSSYYNGTEVVVIVFSLTDKKTFENAESWFSQAKRSADDSATIIVVGTKADEPARTVTAAEAAEFANRHGVKYFEVSAKTGDGTDKLMDAIAEPFFPPEPDPDGPGPCRCC